MDRGRNVLNMLMMNFYCILIIPILWVAVGYSLSQVPFEDDFLGSFDSFFLTEHHQEPAGYIPSPLVLLAALATRTSTIRLGTGIADLPLNHPTRLAEDGAR